MDIKISPFNQETHQPHRRVDGWVVARLSKWVSECVSKLG